MESRYKPLTLISSPPVHQKSTWAAATIGAICMAPVAVVSITIEGCSKNNKDKKAKSIKKPSLLAPLGLAVRDTGLSLLGTMGVGRANSEVVKAYMVPRILKAQSNNGFDSLHSKFIVKNPIITVGDYKLDVTHITPVDVERPSSEERKPIETNGHVAIFLPCAGYWPSQHAEQLSWIASEYRCTVLTASYPDFTGRKSPKADMINHTLTLINWASESSRFSPEQASQNIVVIAFSWGAMIAPEALIEVRKQWGYVIPALLDRGGSSTHDCAAGDYKRDAGVPTWFGARLHHLYNNAAHMTFEPAKAVRQLPSDKVLCMGVDDDRLFPEGVRMIDAIADTEKHIFKWIPKEDAYAETKIIKGKGSREFGQNAHTASWDELHNTEGQTPKQLMGAFMHRLWGDPSKHTDSKDSSSPLAMNVPTTDSAVTPVTDTHQALRLRTV